MVRKKLDNRIRTLIENGVISGFRSMFAIVGDKGRDQVVILHHILSKATFKARPSVLWCYKKELGFSSHRKKRMKQIAKKIRNSGKSDINEEDPFELFISSTRIRYCYYSETHKILGNTFGMLVLQDFEALTPNLLARTIETVEGGGLVVFLLRSVSSLRQLYTMAMDVHARYRTEAHQDIVGRFNERFILSLTDCKACMVVDDELNILPISSHMANIEPLPAKMKDEPSPTELELKQLKESLRDTQPIGALVSCCKTLDQARAVLKFLDAITEKTLRSTVSLTAARGRGKSAALGLAMAGAVAFGYSNIFVTSPSPENLKTLFEFVFKGFDAIDYQEHTDYELIQSTNPEFNKAVVRVNIFREHRQTIQYIHPSDAAKLGQAELVVIDEAAAIPLPLVKQLLGSYLVFMASTINGYEGTGRSLSLKLLQQLREQTATFSGTSKTSSGTQKEKDKELVAASGRTLYEITLEESIRYSPGDPLESWLNNLLCLDVLNVARVNSGCPSPSDCELYYVNRDTLFCFHKASEAFLHRLMSIYVAAHYKNTPNDLQMISDAPAHHLFCLLGPIDPQKASSLPEILCVIQVCLEGEISKTSVINSLSRGKRASGDLIPWTVAQQFQDNDFPTLSGARVVRIATHPDYQSMGYGSRALQLLEQYYEGKIACVSEDAMEEDETNANNGGHIVDDETIGLLQEKIGPRRNLPPLLAKLSERRPEHLDWMGVSYGVTNSLLKFWKRNGYVPVYLRQTPNELTGEHSCIMLKMLNVDERTETMGTDSWLSTYWKDFRRRFVQLLSYQFSEFHPSLAMSLLQLKKAKKNDSEDLSYQELLVHLSHYDIKRLELYSQNLVDHHLITDLLPIVARLYFLKKIDIDLSVAQSAILLGLGLQHKTVDQLVKELDLPSTQLLGLFNRAVRKIVKVINDLCEQKMATDLGTGMTGERKIVAQSAMAQSLEEDLREGAAEFEAQMKQAKKRQQHQVALDDKELAQFAIRGTEDDWNDALEVEPTGNTSKVGGKLGLVSVKRKTMDANQKRRAPPESAGLAHGQKKMKKHGGDMKKKKHRK